MPTVGSLFEPGWAHPSGVYTSAIRGHVAWDSVSPASGCDTGNVPGVPVDEATPIPVPTVGTPQVAVRYDPTVPGGSVKCGLKAASQSTP
jgi:hypothetical protein